MEEMRNHIDEKILELYVLESPLVQEERAAIKRHLKACPWCAAVYREMKSYYEEVGQLQREQAQRASRALMVPERVLRGREVGFGVPIPSGWTLPQRFVDSLRRYPARWSVSFATLVAVLVFALPRLIPGDRNPEVVKPEKEFVVAYNRQGEEIWRTYVGLSIDVQSIPSYFQEQHSQRFPVIDVDQDGRNETFGVFGWANWKIRGNPLLRAVVCFNADGSERWRYELHRTITIGKVPFSDDYRFYQIIVNDLDRDDRYEVIALASHVPWFPNVVVKLDAHNGALLGEYWHNGMLSWIDNRDIDGDGIEELFMGGQNNRLQQANLAVLDPREISGQGPATPEFTVDGVLRGREKFYLLFPASDLKPVWVDITNEVSGVSWKSDSTLEVIVSEKVRSPHQDLESSQPYEGGTLYFYFDRKMRCVRVWASDAFSATHKKYEQLGVVKARIDAAYLERLRQNVQYWDGEKSRFVTYEELKERDSKKRNLSRIR